MENKTDIDIDFIDRSRALVNIPHITAVKADKNGVRSHHATGVYFQEIPYDPFIKGASITYDDAGRYGYFKVDFLNNSLYEGIRDEDHLNDLLSRDPPWELLEERDIVSQLAHIGEHFSVVNTIKPRSIDDLSVVLALIRPGKRYLLNRPRAEIDSLIWKIGDDDEYAFKKSHSVAYAASIVVQLNLLVERACEEIENPIFHPVPL